MQTTAWKEFHLSRMLLGTVQFGMPYGIANRTGQPRYEEVLAMVRAAVDGGVNCFDTAAAYGSSEEVLGRALRELGVVDRVVVMTKVRALSPAEREHAQTATRAIEQSVSASRKNLGIDCLPVVLFHRTEDAAFVEVLESLQQKGWIRHIGVSCQHDSLPAMDLAASGRFSALQLPANMLDGRHQNAGVFKAATERGIAVLIRSVYLQGLLLMPEEAIPTVLSDVIPVRRRLESIGAEAGMSMAEMALRYMLSQPGVSSVLVGVETLAQVQENLALFHRGPLSADVLGAIRSAIHSEFPPLREQIISPGTWPMAT